MPVCTKTLIRAGGNDNVCTVVFKKMSMSRHDIVELACASLDSIAHRMREAQDIAPLLKKVVCKQDMCMPEDGKPTADKAMLVRGLRYAIDVQGKQHSVVCGRAV